MKLIDIYVKNFGSFTEGKHNFTTKGLHLVLGNNKLFGFADDNGSGKSTLFVEAPYWALYGDTIKGMDADRVVKDGSKGGCEVVMNLEAKGHKVKVERYRKHPKHKNKILLFIDGEDRTLGTNKQTQELLEQIIGFDAMAFCRTTMHNENSALAFATASDREQKTFMEHVLDLGSFNVAQEKAKALAKATELEIDRLNREILVFSEKLDELHEDIASTGELSDAFESDKAEKLGALNAFLNELKEKQLLQEKHLQTVISKTDKKINNFNARLEEIRKEINSAQDAQNKATGIERTILRKEAELDRSAEKLERITNEIEETYKALDSINEASCKSCGQVLPVQDRALREFALGKKIEELEGKASNEAELTNDIFEWLDNAPDPQKVLSTDKLYEESAITQASIQDLKALKRNEELLASDLTRKVEGTEQQISYFDTENPYAEIITKKNATYQEVEKRSSEVVQALEILKEEAFAANFWVRGFGNQGLKSLILDSVVPFLDEQVNKYTDILTDGHIRVNFSTLTKLKTGEYRDKFSVDIESSTGAKSHKEASGGEKRRIDTAVMLALGKLAESRHGNTGFLVFDEVFDKLDAMGIERVMGILHELAGEKQIIVISHVSDLKNLFPTTITVTRTESGSTTDAQ